MKVQVEIEIETEDGSSPHHDDVVKMLVRTIRGSCSWHDSSLCRDLSGRFWVSAIALPEE